MSTTATLTTSLREATRLATQAALIAEKQAKEREFRSNIEMSKKISTEIIADLPRFLKKMAEARHFSAFIVGLDRHRPWQFEWEKYSRSQTVHRTRSGDLPEWWIRKHLFGVPRRVALWAKRQGFTVCIKTAYHFGDRERRPDEAIYMRDENGARPSHEGIVICW